MLKHTTHSLQILLTNLALTIAVEVSIKLQTSAVHYSKSKPVSCSIPPNPGPVLPLHVMKKSCLLGEA